MLKTFFLCFITIHFSHAQQVKVTGKITDSTSTPLSFANIIADPIADASLVFSISNEEGYYTLKLERGQTYRITVSYLGYIPQTFEFTPEAEGITRNFMLAESSERLGEVNIDYIPPIVVKTDTITYRTDAFTTGEERKLKDILKKLPAVEVDREGNVIVQGKRVTTILVENREFFTGNSKLAVNNIPADAVDRVEVLDNYSEVAFLKDLEESQEIAMNIKLKKNKKRFLFGDIEIGGGRKERYLIHPSLYYYSPKTSVNGIGDFNNIGTKSFTINDYLEFEGGKNRLLSDTKGYFSLLNDNFAQFLGAQNFTASINKFGALSLDRTVKNNTHISAYGIWSGLQNKIRTETFNNFIFSHQFFEDRTNVGEEHSNFGIGKLALKLEPDSNYSVAFNSYVKASQNSSKSQLLTTTNERTNRINTHINGDNVSAKQDVQWHRRFNEIHTSSAVFNYHYQTATPDFNWKTDQALLSGLIPLVTEDSFNIFKKEVKESHNLDFGLKHYWVLDRFHHLYISAGTQIAFDDYFTSEFQTLENGSINDFSNAGFGNNTELEFYNNFLGVHYKTQRGKVTIKPGLFYHYYKWKVLPSTEPFYHEKNVLLPEFNAVIEFSNSKKLDFKYNLKARFADISQLADRYTMLNFHSVYYGNIGLENELYHHLQLYYRHFNFFKDISYNISASYRFKENNFKNATNVQGINFASSPILSDFQDKVWSFHSSLKKGLGNYKVMVNSNITLADYEKPINSTIFNNELNNYSFGAGVETQFRSFPNFEMIYTKSISDYEGVSESKFQTDIFSFYLEYDFFTDFVLKADYRFENYKNRIFDTATTFDFANASLFYQTENSPWGFEVSAENIFNVRYLKRNSFSDILVSDEKTYVLPRTMLFKVAYKL